MSEDIVISRRLTSNFIDLIPPQVQEFTAELYLIVPTKNEQLDIRINPCVFDWATKRITMVLPKDLNPDITGVNDLNPDWFDGVQAAFYMLIVSCC